MPHLDELAMQARPAGPCFIAEVQLLSATRQFVYHLADVAGAMGNRSPVPNFTPCAIAKETALGTPNPMNVRSSMFSLPQS